MPDGDVIIGPRSKEASGMGPVMGMDLSDEDQATFTKAKKLFNAAKKGREMVSRHWRHYYKMWATDQWHDIWVDEWRSRPQVNFIYSTIELGVATETDQDPQIVVYPRSNNEDQMRVSEVQTKIFEDGWRRARARLALKHVRRNSRIFGTGVFKGGWDVEKKAFSVISVPPDQWYPDPAATNDEDLWYAFHVYDVSMNEIRANWPDMVHKVRAGRMMDTDQFRRDVWASEHQDPFGGTGTLTHTEGTTTTSTDVDFKEGTSFPEPDDVMTTIMEFWEKSPEDGTITLHYIAGGQVLQTIEEPLGPRMKRFPFVRSLNVPVDGSYWGLSEIQALEPMQLSINKRRQQMIDLLRVTGNPPLLATQSAGLEDDIFLGAPGEVLTIGNRGEVHWMPTPGLPQGLVELQQMDKSEMETVSGLFDVVQGKTPTGIEAAAAIAELQEAAQVRLRDRVAMMESSLEELGSILLLLVQQNYTAKQALTLLGKEGVLETVEINQPIQNAAVAQEMEQQAIEDAAEVEVVERALDVTRGDFDVLVKAGSTLPVSKMARLNEAVMLFDRGANLGYGPIMFKEMLKAMDHPRQKEITDQINAMEQAQAQQAAQEQAAAFGAGGAEVSPAEENPT